MIPVLTRAFEAAVPSPVQYLQTSTSLIWERQQCSKLMSGAPIVTSQVGSALQLPSAKLFSHEFPSEEWGILRGPGRHDDFAGRCTVHPVLFLLKELSY